MDAVVWQVGRVLGRGHALFGEPLVSGGVAARDAGRGLGAAGDAVGRGRVRMGAQRGVLTTRYDGLATDAGAALDASGAADEGLGSHLHDAAGADRSGRRASGAVLDGAASDVGALGLSSRTAAGQRAIVSALRARVAQQRQVIATFQARDARLAEALRSLSYRGAGMGGGVRMPISGVPFTGGGFAGAGGGGFPLSALSGLTGGGAGRFPRAVLAANVDGLTGIGDADEPGRGAAEAALSKRGRPYVWGAKGPSSFDCSGLTQWAWRQAGVRLGGTTYSQIGDGVAVPPGQVRAGDLIFPLDSFGEGGRSGPGHVELAISATEVVHAPTPGDVVRVAPMPGRYVARRPLRSPLA